MGLDVIEEIKKESKAVQNQYDADRLAVLMATIEKAYRTGEKQLLCTYFGVDVWVSSDGRA